MCASCIVLKAAKPAAVISDMEREWNAGVKVGRLATPSGELPGLMKVRGCGQTMDPLSVDHLFAHLATSWRCPSPELPGPHEMSIQCA